MVPQPPLPTPSLQSTEAQPLLDKRDQPRGSPALLVPETIVVLVLCVLDQTEIN
jgi:hypothetical protein